MSKIIIHNNSGGSDAFACTLVESVLMRGFMSGERQYCWHTHWRDYKASVIAMPTRGETYTFKVIDEELDR